MLCIGISTGCLCPFELKCCSVAWFMVERFFQTKHLITDRLLQEPLIEVVSVAERNKNNYS